MTAEELLKLARQHKPGVKYVRNAEGDAIGGWNEILGRYQAVAYIGSDGEWYSMPCEILIDGKPKPETWIES